ncbi:MAG: class I SAM-dependent methyltransferase [Thermoplasmata archaeon]|nr:class I SAM-dependent methyltransferase [Thermoplasmata archaeon]
MTEQELDKARYPMEWNASYEAKGTQWRGYFDLASYSDILFMDGLVLELGSGDGNTASQLVKTADNLVCLDIAPSSFKVLPMSELEVHKTIGDARLMPFRAEKFSSIICRHVLTHAIPGDSEAILKEIARVLSPEGVALFEVFTPKDMRWGKGVEIMPDTFLRGDKLICRFYLEEEIIDMLKDSGFYIVKSELHAREVLYDGSIYVRESLVIIASFS